MSDVITVPTAALRRAPLELVAMDADVDLLVHIDSSTLQAALKQLAPIVPQNPAQRILACVLLTATPAGVQLTATDLQVTLERSMPAEVHVPGALAVPAKLLTDLVKQLRPGVPLTLTVAAGTTTLTLTTADASLTLAGLPADDMPTLPGADVTAPYATLDRTGFCAAIAQVVPAVSQSTTKPSLQGISFQVRDGALRLAATDQCCLAVRSQTLAYTGDHTPDLVVPGRALADAVRSLVADDAPELVLTINPSRTQIRLATPTLAVTLRIIDGTFPAWERFVPATSPTTSTAVLQTADLRQVLKLLKAMAPTGQIVNLTLTAAAGDTPSQLRFQASQVEVASATQTMPVAFAGATLKTAFNLSYLLEVLEVMDSPRMQFTCNGPTFPGVWTPSDDPAAIYLVMPMRVQEVTP